jgi:hypothetical protein
MLARLQAHFDPVARAPRRHPETMKMTQRAGSPEQRERHHRQPPRGRGLPRSYGRIFEAALLMLLLVTAPCLVAPAGAAPQIGPLGDGFHGVGLLPDEDAPMAYGVWVAATSRDPQAIEPQALPANLADRIRDTEEGAYVREEWDKGAALRDQWSARWTGTLNVEKEGEYTFCLTTDDGARMTIDGEEIIDAWVPRPPTTSEAKLNLAAGDHEVIVEYFEAGGRSGSAREDRRPAWLEGGVLQQHTARW